MVEFDGAVLCAFIFRVRKRKRRYVQGTFHFMKGQLYSLYSEFM